jgi:hypothetical protein
MARMGVNSGSRRAVPIKPINACSIDRHTLLPSLLHAPPRYSCCSPLKLPTVHPASHYTLNLACRFQVTVPPLRCISLLPRSTQDARCMSLLLPSCTYTILVLQCFDV